jgi:hypothetical protein
LEIWKLSETPKTFSLAFFSILKYIKMAKFKIPAIIFHYSLMFGATIGFSVIYVRYFGKSEEEKLKLLQENYASSAEQRKTKEQSRKNLQAFFDSIKDPVQSKEREKEFQGLDLFSHR